MMDERLREGETFADYKIQGLIASGGMGQVYVARHRLYKRLDALKVLHPRLHQKEDWRKRFDWEGLVGEHLRHPNILSARQRVHASGRIGLVLDLVPEGQTLEKLISREFPNGLEPGLAVDLFLKILGGMEYLHQRDPPIVHGDVKPENVLIEGKRREPRTWEPKVTDFGTVALIANPVEIEGRPAVVATPRYASPEHMYGVNYIELRSDIYCLGLLFHYILCGRHASNAQDVQEAAECVQRPVPITYLVACDVPPELISVFQKMVAVDPAARYTTAQSVALHLATYREGDGGTSHEYSDVDPDLKTEEDADAVAALVERTSYSQAPTRNDPRSPARLNKASSAQVEFVSASHSDGILSPPDPGHIDEAMYEHPRTPPRPISLAAVSGTAPQWPRQRGRLSIVLGWTMGIVLLAAIVFVSQLVHRG